MADTLASEADTPKPMTSCPRCGAEDFEHGRRVGLSQEIFCRQCHAGYLVNVHHDGLFLVEPIRPRPRRHPEHRPGHRRRQTDD